MQTDPQARLHQMKALITTFLRQSIRCTKNTSRGKTDNINRLSSAKGADEPLLFLNHFRKESCSISSRAIFDSKNDNVEAGTAVKTKQDESATHV